MSVRIGASLFIAGAALSVGTMLAPHSDAANEVGFYWLGLVELLIGLLALALRGDAARRDRAAAVRDRRDPRGQRDALLQRREARAAPPR